ncbi:uncharacterized protein LOC135464211 [Liolophura sinensis]|uniref:uncharacterized protein LOC135464211 n=1 Tax=Liolophura sinensis TaxID=3198878 RepID=UPI003158748D
MFICVSDVISQVDVIDQYVEGLLTDRGSKWSESSELEIFLTNPRREFLKGFVFGYVLDLAYTYLEAYVEKKFFKLKLRDKRRPATSGFVHKLAQLPGTERIQKILNVDGYEGTVRNRRCKEALVRDVVALLVSNKLHISLPEARRRCCQTEHSSLHTALKKSEQLRAHRLISSTES